MTTTTTTTTPQAKANFYFYNGFEAPQLIATTWEQLKNVAITDNYLGDIRDEFLEEVNSINKNDTHEEINETLGYFDTYYNPTLKELVIDTLSWFDRNSFPYDLLKDFGTKQEINKVLNEL